jgi:hypothetical protein
MDNSNKSLSDSIIELKNGVKMQGTEDVLDQATTTGNSFFGWIKNISFFNWFLFFLFLTFLGFNIFIYLAQGSEEIKRVFAPILKQVFGYTIVTTSQTVDVAAEGSKAVVSGTATGINKGLTAVQNATPNNLNEEPKSKLENVLNKKKSENQNNDYVPHEASSSVYKGKAGWCFIGEDRGHRSCVKVSETDKCMSGDIFPTQAVCINPNLRV